MVMGLEMNRPSCPCYIEFTICWTERTFCDRKVPVLYNIRKLYLHENQHITSTDIPSNSEANQGRSCGDVDVSLKLLKITNVC